MMREDYLKELRLRLSHRMTMPELERMMGYYGAYFEEAGPQREAEIIRELGTPEELVRRITEGRIEKALECPDAGSGGRKSSAGALWGVILAVCAAPIAISLAVGLTALTVALGLVALCAAVGAGAAGVGCIAMGAVAVWAGGRLGRHRARYGRRGISGGSGAAGRGRAAGACPAERGGTGMRRLGRAVAGLGILLLLAGAAMSFAGWRMGGESWLEIEAAGHIVSMTPFGIRSWNEKGRRGAESAEERRDVSSSEPGEVDTLEVELGTGDVTAEQETDFVVDLPRELRMVCPEYPDKDRGFYAGELSYDFSVEAPTAVRIEVEHISGSLTLGIRRRSGFGWAYESRTFETESDSVELEPGQYRAVFTAAAFQGSCHMTGESV